MDGLTYFILTTYAVQFILVCFFRVPSAGSTVEMVCKVKKAPGPARYHPAAAAIRSRPQMIMLILATLAVTAAWLIPLIAGIYPPIIKLLVPFMASPPKLMKAVCIVLLISGNVLTCIAVATLRSHVSFTRFGETTRLHTSGIYSCSRNPVTVGLALIFAGFFLALPSAAMLIGFIIFLLNSAYRIKMEEIYLHRTFGEDYEQYKQQVGKYFPKLERAKY